MDVREAVQGLGKRIRCETLAKGSGTLQPGLEEDFPLLTSLDGGSHNLGRNSLYCLKL